MSEQYQQQVHEKTFHNTQKDPSFSPLNDGNEFEQEQKNRQFSSKEKGNHRSQQNNKMQKPKASVQWNLFQHLYSGKGFTRQEMSSKYNEFKENERTFHWDDSFQLAVTANGKLKDPDSPSGCEAMKTGIFDEQQRLRRRGEIPYSVFQAKMFAMGIKDRSKISSMYSNMTGSTALQTRDLKQYSYRTHAAVGTTRRDADHQLELQVVVAELQKEHLNDDDHHALRCILNGEDNIVSRGVKFNRHIKGVANRGIARNYIELVKPTLQQERVQAEQVDKLAGICHQQGFSGVESVFRRVADKCKTLHSIHSQMMQLDAKSTDSKENCERESQLIQDIRQYEQQYGPLRFHGPNFTNYRKEILDKAHTVQ